MTIIHAMLAESRAGVSGPGDVSATSWGNMLYWAYEWSALLQGAWWWFAPPGLCIALAGRRAGALNFGIDELADPRLRECPVKAAVNRRRWRDAGK